MRLPSWALPHTISVRRVIGSSSVGVTHGEAEPLAALHVEEPGTATDQRPSSQTRNEEVATAAHAVLQYEDGPILPESLVTFQGTTRQVVQCARNDHPDAPSSTQVWMV